MLKINDQTFRGQEACKRYLCQNVSVRDELEKNLRDKLMNPEPSDGDESIASDITDEEALAVAEA